MKRGRPPGFSKGTSKRGAAAGHEFLELSQLAGDWVSSFQNEVWTINEFQETLKNGELAPDHARVIADERGQIFRPDGWIVDMKASSATLLIWRHPNGGEVHWQRQRVESGIAASSVPPPLSGDTEAMIRTANGETRPATAEAEPELLVRESPTINSTAGKRRRTEKAADNTTGQVQATRAHHLHTRPATPPPQDIPLEPSAEKSLEATNTEDSPEISLVLRHHAGASVTDSTAPSRAEVKLEEEEVTYWRYLPCNSVAIRPRVEPQMDAAQHEVEIQYGAMLKVRKEQKGADGVLFLQLAEGGGWLFDRKPGVGRMCVREAMFEHAVPEASSTAAASAASAEPQGNFDSTEVIAKSGYLRIMFPRKKGKGIQRYVALSKFRLHWWLTESDFNSGAAHQSYLDLKDIESVRRHDTHNSFLVCLNNTISEVGFAVDAGREELLDWTKALIGALNELKQLK